MLLSIQQKFILEALRKLGCVRRDQLHALVQGKFQRPDFEVSEARMTAMLRQLRSGMADFHMDGDFVYLARGQPDATKLEAIDVMLELSEGSPLCRPANGRLTLLLWLERVMKNTLSGGKNYA